MSDTFDTPPGEDVFQSDEPAAAVPVEVVGTVRTEEMPTRTTGFRTFNVTPTGAQQILDNDPRRKSATIIPLTDDIRIAGDQSSAVSPAGTLLPLGMPLVLTSSDAIWAASVLAATDISVFFELWAR